MFGMGGCYGALGQTGLLSMHDAPRVENFVLVEANMRLSKICGPMEVLGCPFS